VEGGNSEREKREKREEGGCVCSVQYMSCTASRKIYSSGKIYMYTVALDVKINMYELLSSHYRL